MARHGSRDVARVVLFSSAALMGGVVAASLILRQRRPPERLVIGRDWQRLDAEPISPASPVAMRLRPWIERPDPDPTGEDDIYTACDDADKAPVITAGPYRPIVRRGPPIDDSGRGDA